MSPIKKQLVDVIDCLPEQEQILLFEIAKRFISDDVANADDVEAVRAARQEYANGETVNHDAINWDFPRQIKGVTKRYPLQKRPQIPQRYLGAIVMLPPFLPCAYAKPPKERPLCRQLHGGFLLCGLAMLAIFWLICAQVAHSYAIFRDFSGIVRGSSPISIIERKISALNSMKHNHNFSRLRKQREPKKAVSACS